MVYNILNNHINRDVVDSIFLYFWSKLKRTYLTTLTSNNWMSSPPVTDIKEIVFDACVV